MGSLHQIARRLAWMRHFPGSRPWNRLLYKREHPALARDVFGLSFPHPLGLAPVLERQVDLLDAWSDLGFAFSGILPGPLSAIPAVAEKLSSRKSTIYTFVELRAEGDSEEQAKNHLVRVYSLMYDFADAFVVDINRQSGVTSFDDISDWSDILEELLHLRLYYEKYRPILVRLATNDTDEQLQRTLEFCLLSGIDGVIAPGAAKVAQVITLTKGRLPVIGSGAVKSIEEAQAMLSAGASLLEIAQGLPTCTCSTAKRLLKALDTPSRK